MLPIYKSIFDKIDPGLSKEAKIDNFPVARWFGEETFTYIRVFGSIAAPNVLPYYVTNKLLEREIVYQAIGDGLTKAHLIWPTFLLHCGTFALHDYGNAVKK